MDPLAQQGVIPRRDLSDQDSLEAQHTASRVHSMVNNRSNWVLQKSMPMLGGVLNSYPCPPPSLLPTPSVSFLFFLVPCVLTMFQ